MTMIFIGQDGKPTKNPTKAHIRGARFLELMNRDNQLRQRRGSTTGSNLATAVPVEYQVVSDEVGDRTSELWDGTATDCFDDSAAEYEHTGTELESHVNDLYSKEDSTSSPTTSYNSSSYARSANDTPASSPEVPLGFALVCGVLYAVYVVVTRTVGVAVVTVREVALQTSTSDWTRQTINTSHQARRLAASASNASAVAPTAEVTNSGIRKLLMKIEGAQDLYSLFGGLEMNGYLFGLGSYTVHCICNLKNLPPFCDDKAYWYHSLSSSVRSGSSSWNEIVTFEPIYSFDSEVYVCVKQDVLFGKNPTIGRVSVPLRALLSNPDMTTTGPGTMGWFTLFNPPYRSGGEIMISFKFA